MLNGTKPGSGVPLLREELRLLAAAPQPDGSPAWHVLDPVRNRFFRIGWLEFELLLRWPLGDAAAIADAVARETTLATHTDDVEALARFLHQNELLQPTPGVAARDLTRRRAAQRGVWLKRLLHNYLFFRVPLIHPRQFLVRLEVLTRGLFSPSFVTLSVLAGVLGGVLAARQWDRVLVGLGDSLSVRGFLAYLSALLVAKSLHELAHALTATRYGVRVAHMGVALVVLAPMLYTDTGESWKVTNHRARLRIAAAGMAAELILAAWATLAWALLPDGELRAASFFLATTSWFLSLLVNLSPFMRFDGYFILADALDLPNLHGRSSALARLRLRRVLFGVDAPDPEPFPPWKANLLAAFSAATWFYRLVVFFGIALAVYHFFFKLLGVFLFAVEIAWFIVLPIWRELREWPSFGEHISATRRHVYLGMLLALLAFLFWPWQTTVYAPGWVFPATQRVLYSPQAAKVVTVSAHNGQRVDAGQALFELEVPEIEDQARQATILAQAYARQAASLPVLNQRGEAQSARMLQQARELAQQAKAQTRAAERLLLGAPFSGTVRDLAEGLQPGIWVTPRWPLARIVDEHVWRGELLVPEHALARLALGQSVLLYSSGEPTAPLRGQIAAIDPTRLTVLPHPMFDARSGGPIVTRPEAPREAHGESREVVSEALYRVSVTLAEHDEHTPAPPKAEGLRHGRIDAEAQSVWQQWLRPLLATLVRESGF